MPKIEMSIWRNSARLGRARASAKQISAKCRFIDYASSRLEKPCEIDGHANPFAWIDGADVLVDRKLHAARDGVVLVHAECRRPDEYLIASASGNISARSLERPKTLAS